MAEWQLLTAVYHGRQEKAILYRDGQVVASESMELDSGLQPGKGFLHLGKYSIDEKEYGTVTIDELKLWNRALTDEKVKALFESYTNDDLTSGKCFLYFLFTAVEGSLIHLSVSKLYGFVPGSIFALSVDFSP